ncbi:MAG: hypothetical protein RIS19_952 [Actinomycetota bacterium]
MNTKSKPAKNKNSKIGLTLDISYRIVATFIASALGVIGAGSIIGLDVWMSAALGGLLAVAKVVEKLALAFLEDGKISRSEVNMIFSQVVRLKEAGEDQANAPKSKK